MNEVLLGGHCRLMVIGIAVVLASTLSACNPLGEDWKLMPTSIGYEHHGSTIQIEPGEAFRVDLRANGVSPEAPWQMRATDSVTIELTGTEHDAEVRARGDHQEGPETPEPWDYIGGTTFEFVGRSEGVSQLIFDLQAEDQVVDVYELTVSVRDDACDVDEGTTGIITPIRCEEEAPDGHEVVLAYDNYGWAVQLEPGGEFTVELRANGLHPEVSWQVVETNPAVVDLQWSIHDTDVQSLVEHSGWPPTIFPETRLGFIGKELGESPLLLELAADGVRLDAFELAVFVVDDACDMGPEPFNIFTPHSCG